jgi:PIN domain nuclease of toxin-antitoxin system
MAGTIKIVLDTCALIWWSLDPDKLSQPAKKACQKMEQEKNGLVPSIAIWEIAIKIKNNESRITNHESQQYRVSWNSA